MGSTLKVQVHTGHGILHDVEAHTASPDGAVRIVETLIKNGDELRGYFHVYGAGGGQRRPTQSVHIRWGAVEAIVCTHGQPGQPS